MEKLLTKKRSYIYEKSIELEAGCSAIIKKGLSLKSKNPKSFNLPMSIAVLSMDKALLDLGASINLIHFVMLKKIGELEIKST